MLLSLAAYYINKTLHRFLRHPVTQENVKLQDFWCTQIELVNVELNADALKMFLKTYGLVDVTHVSVDTILLDIPLFNLLEDNIDIVCRGVQVRMKPCPSDKDEDARAANGTAAGSGARRSRAPTATGLMSPRKLRRARSIESTAM